MSHLYLPISAISIIIDIISVFVYYRIICNVRSIDKDHKPLGLQRYILFPISRTIQLVYLYNIEYPRYADFSILIDYILYFCIDIWIWCHYFKFNEAKKRRCLFITGISMVFLISLTGLLIYDVSIIYKYYQTVRITASIVNLSNFIIYIATVRSDNFIKGYFARIGNRKYYKLPKFYVKNTVIIMYLNIFILTTSYIIGGHNGRLIANVYNIILNLYILNFWISNVIIDFINFGAIKYKNISSSNGSDKILINNEDRSNNKRQEKLFDKILESVHNAISEEKLYLNPDLRMQDLLLYVNTNRTYLSAAINSNDTNFTRLVLTYRLCHFHKVVSENENILISDAALESGFTTSKILCRVFRQVLDTTPSSFRNLTRDEQISLLKKNNLYIDKYMPYMTNL